MHIVVVCYRTAVEGWQRVHRQSHRSRRDHAEDEERNLPVCPALHSLQSTFCSSADSLSICLSLLTHTHTLLYCGSK